MLISLRAIIMDNYFSQLLLWNFCSQKQAKSTERISMENSFKVAVGRSSHNNFTEVVLTNTKVMPSADTLLGNF